VPIEFAACKVKVYDSSSAQANKVAVIGVGPSYVVDP